MLGNKNIQKENNLKVAKKMNWELLLFLKKTENHGFSCPIFKELSDKFSLPKCIANFITKVYH